MLGGTDLYEESSGRCSKLECQGLEKILQLVTAKHIGLTLIFHQITHLAMRLRYDDCKTWRHDAILIDSGRKTEIYRRCCPWKVCLHQPRLEDAVVIGLLMASQRVMATREAHI